MALPKPAGLTLDGNGLTDHSRGPIELTFITIENVQRMWNGRLRKRFIASKRNISTSWSLLPSVSVHTVDGLWGADDLRSFYESNTDDFPVTITYTDLSTETFNAVFTNFSMGLNKRGVYDLYTVSLSLEEV